MISGTKLGQLIVLQNTFFGLSAPDDDQVPLGHSFELTNHDTHQPLFLTFVDLKVQSFMHILLGRYLFFEFSRAVLISTLLFLLFPYTINVPEMPIFWHLSYISQTA